MNANVPPEATSKALVLKPPSMLMPPEAEAEFSLTTAKWRVLVDQIFPSAKSAEAVMMALSYCQARNLDIFKKVVHIVPMWSSLLKKEVETVWPGIAEIRTTAARTGEYAGIDAIEFGPMIEAEFGTGNDRKTVRFPEWASVVVYRWVKGEKAAFHTILFWEETYASIGNTDVPNKMWCKRPRGQFDKCVEAAALRKAFPEELGSTYAAEEMEGRTIDYEPAKPRPETARITPKPPSPPTPPSPDKIAAAIDPIPENGFDRDVEGMHDGAEAAEEDRPEAFDYGKFFEDFQIALQGAKSAAAVEEIWTEFDVEAQFHDDESSRQLADKIKARRLAALTPPSAG
ncbi:phage recombination protein Bet [Mesorhizobium sp.]|uniref:phage recombination protein Bet n=1 Tax=Mesorhizobium sp. TaxID=1871066 RepID=UPI000FE7215A|nr:phage recombination protein Bet [Mesorhizobium sp.]RWH31575.1 MAG: phage recombination protein Bet [Mesorhizobium sp.]RWH38039.1 MAG: phage recombination protein Bet [Mesorhizobium sp.]TIR62126.1 MAG: phage recombination protein Bet [Mesorhizobium sp.]TIR72193.1 MAG: phage recombination protein Bet [Mesorhizobium sp.]